jgi:hypothetical protein
MQHIAEKCVAEHVQVLSAPSDRARKAQWISHSAHHRKTSLPHSENGHGKKSETTFHNAEVSYL